MRLFLRKLDPIWKWSREAKELPLRLVRFGVFFAVVLAFSLRLAAWRVEPVLSRDGVKYVRNALSIQEKRRDPGVAVSPVMPTSHDLYASYLSSGLFSLGPHALGVTTNIVLGSLLPLLMFGIAMLLFRQRELALACALFAAVCPPLVWYGIEVQREMPHIFFFGCFLFFALLFLRSVKWYWCAATGVSAALCFLSRYEGLEFIPVLAAVFAVWGWREKKISRAALYFLLCMACFVLTVGIALSLIGFSVPDFLWEAAKKASGYLRRR